MLEALLVYLGETQREGRVVTRRLRATIILSVLTGIFFLIAFIAAVVAGSIYLARHVGAGPAALVVAGTAFLLGVIMLVALAIVKRPRVYAARPAVAPLTAAPLAAAPLALQSLGGKKVKPLRGEEGIPGDQAFLSGRHRHPDR